MIRLQHAKVELALHELRGGFGGRSTKAAPQDPSDPADAPPYRAGPPIGRVRTLLLLHGLGERSPRELPEELSHWPGRIHALDFTGHGESTVPRGGGYQAETLMGDVDVALGHLGPSTIVGRGLGAYVAVLIAGARPRSVRGAILRDGPGMSGGGSRPGTPQVVYVDPTEVGPPDPFALAELSRDLRPPDYATSFVRQATHLSGLHRPLTVCARERPDWLRAVVEEPGVEESSLEEALSHYARLV